MQGRKGSILASEQAQPDSIATPGKREASGCSCKNKGCRSVEPISLQGNLVLLTKVNACLRGLT